MQDGDSLLAGTLKARYFLDNDFLSAQVGYNSSYTWQSITEGRRVLQLDFVLVIVFGMIH